MSRIKRERTLKSRTVFKGRVLNVEVLDIEVEPGKRSVREIVRHLGAAVVLARLADGRFVFVRQFRKAVEREMLEVVAGGLERGEAPAACAARELTEETGYKASRLIKLGTAYPAPGYTDEKLHIFFADVRSAQGVGEPDEDERIEVSYLSEKDVDGLIKAGKIHDAKTLSAWLLWKMRVKTGKKV